MNAATNEGTDDLAYESEAGIAYITFNRPAVRNAMTSAMYERLVAACDRIDADDEIRVAVLRGAGGKAFVAGTDIAQFVDFDGEAGVRYERNIDRVLSRLESVRVPTVAVVQGFAVGGGLAIAAACDLRVCTPNSQFGLPIARTLGNCVSMATCARLVSLIGPDRTTAMIITAAMIGADEADRIGLVTDVIADEHIDTHVAELCRQIAGHAPLTLAATKSTIRHLRAAELPDGDDIVRAVYDSTDFREGVSAFLAKRRPVWQGR